MTRPSIVRKLLDSDDEVAKLLGCPAGEASFDRKPEAGTERAPLLKWG